MMGSTLSRYDDPDADLHHRCMLHMQMHVFACGLSWQPWTVDADAPTLLIRRLLLRSIILESDLTCEVAEFAILCVGDLGIPIRTQPAPPTPATPCGARLVMRAPGRVGEVTRAPRTCCFKVSRTA